MGKKFSKHLSLIAKIVFFAGAVLYFIGYSQKIEGLNGGMIIGSTIQAGARAILSSLGMFVFDTDFIEVDEVYHHNIFYLVAFALTHFLGVLITMYFILRLCGNRFLSNRRMNSILKNKANSEICVFWGINEDSITLATSIKEEKEKAKDKDFELLFVETPSENELEIKEHSLSHFFYSSISGSSITDRIKELEGTILYPKRRLIDVEKEVQNNVNDGLQNKEERDLSKNGKEIFEKLDLSKLYKFICDELQKMEESNISNKGKTDAKKTGQVRFFFLSDDEQKNIQDTLIIQSIFKNKTIDDKLQLYCKSRDNYANRAIINAEGLFITKLIDDAALSITTLKELRNNNKDYISHPVNFVDPDNDKGVARNPFTALIIGFGTAGQDALRFLYEYGTFIKAPNVESPFKCTIIDKNMDNIKGHFFREVPILESNEKPESINNIKFWNYDWNSEGFKEKFTSEMLDELNYVVIVTGEDKSNISIAAELYEYALKNRKAGVENFRIFVRVYDKENEKQMDAVSDFYKTNDGKDTITLFGRQSDIYTYKNIIKDEETENKAKEFFDTYIKIAGYNDSWDKREEKIKDKNTTYAERLKLLHQRGQDYSNVLHMYTKIKLCKYNRGDMPNMEEFSFKDNYYTASEKLECCRNLSELEHLRWNAAHYMAGFLCSSEKNFRKKTHPCLKPFNCLDETVQSCDYAPVITTFELAKR